MRTRVRYEHADTPEQQRAIRILALLLRESQKRIRAKAETMEPKEGVNRNHIAGGKALDADSYSVYTNGGRA